MSGPEVFRLAGRTYNPYFEHPHVPISQGKLGLESTPHDTLQCRATLQLP